MSAALLPVDNLSDLADELGRLRAEIACLTQRKRDIENMLKESGVDSIDGRDYSVTISHSIPRTTVNWKKIATDLGASSQRISGNTTISFYDRVIITARRV